MFSLKNIFTLTGHGKSYFWPLEKICICSNYEKQVQSRQGPHCVYYMYNIILYVYIYVLYCMSTCLICFSCGLCALTVCCKGCESQHKPK